MNKQISSIAKSSIIGLAVGMGAGAALAVSIKNKEKGPLKKAANKMMDALSNFATNMDMLTK